MAHHGAALARGRRFSTSPSPSHPTSLLPDTADLPITAPHINRLPSPSSHVHSVPGSATSAAVTPRRSPSSSIPRAHDMDQHHHHQHQHQHGQGRSRPTTLQRVATGLRRLTLTSDVRAISEEDWSVFGEAMAHEGVQPPPPPSLISTPVDEAGYTPVRRTLSPESDAHLEDHFPSPEERQREVREGEQDDEEGRSSLDTGLLASHSHVDSDTESTSLPSPKDTDQEGHSLRRGGRKGRSWWKGPSSRLPTLPTLYRNILKCSLAYFLGSLFTYYPPLSRFISELTQDGPGEKYPSAMGHMVATV